MLAAECRAVQMHAEPGCPCASDRGGYLGHSGRPESLFKGFRQRLPRDNH